MENNAQAISILLPINRDNPFFQDALESINIASTGLKIELVVVCNQMTKNQFQDIEIKIIRNVKIPFQIHNIGEVTLVDALNFGISQCKNQLIARFDSDDLMDRRRLLIQANYLSKNIETGLIGSWVRVIQDSEITKQIVKFPVGHSEIIKLLKFGNTFSHPSVMYRKNIIENVGGYSNNFEGAEDFDLWLRLSKVTNLYNFPDTLISYRVHKNQTSNIKKNIQIKSLKNLIIREAIISKEIRGEYMLNINYENGMEFEKISDVSNRLIKVKILKILGPIHTQSYRNVKCRVNIALLRYNLPLDLKKSPLYLLYFSRAILFNPLLFIKFLAMRRL